MRLDSLTWQGVVDDTLITYQDSLHIIKGDVSDSALIVNYNILSASNYADVRSHRDSVYSSYWTGLNHAENLSAQQIYLRRMPGIPAPVGIAYHYDYLRAPGAWMHLAMRERTDKPTGISSVRRIGQFGSSYTPSLVASAEQFYKVTNKADDRDPVASGGFEVDGQEITARVVMDDGRSMSFLPVYSNASTPSGYSGNPTLAWLHAQMSTPVRELISEMFTVDDARQIKLISSGKLRTQVEVSIEEVSPDDIGIDDNGKPCFKNYLQPQSSTKLEFAQPNREKPNSNSKAGYYLTNGESKMYRLRMRYTGNGGVVFRHHVDIDPEEETFDKRATEEIRVVDLKDKSDFTLGTTNAIRVFPNPSSNSITLIIDASLRFYSESSVDNVQLDIVNSSGTVVLTSTVKLGEVLHIDSLETGVYVARVRDGLGISSGTYNSTMFIIVR